MRSYNVAHSGCCCSIIHDTVDPLFKDSPQWNALTHLSVYFIAKDTQPNESV